MNNRKHLLGWAGIVAAIAVTLSAMALASATGLAKTPAAGTLEAEESGGNPAADSLPTPVPGASSITVDVTLSEWSISLSVASANAGAMTFNIKNTGPDKSHEFIILKTDIAPDALPTLKDKSLNESGSGITSPGESNVLAVGKNQSITVNMTPGAYVFVDNIVEKSGLVHWENKPYATFTVTGDAPAQPPVNPPPTSVSADGHLIVSGGVLGGMATATVHTTAGTSCSIVYTHPSGKVSTASGLGPKTAGPDGSVSWTWLISPQTKPVGQGSVTVTCGNTVTSAPITIDAAAN